VTSAARTPDGLPPLRAVIRDLGLSARKGLGQNFILDLNLTRRIARAAALDGRATAVEIGPGPGGLTRALLLEGAARVIAIETDARCRPALELLFADARTLAWERLAPSTRPMIVANLPYNIATTLLVTWLAGDAWPPWYRGMVLMFQQEVAERIVAAPATKAYGRLAVLAQWRTHPRLRFKVPATAFMPPPKVTSAVVAFEPIEHPHPSCSAVALGRVTAAAFGQRRKMLRQSLRSLVAEPEPLLAAAGIASTQRGEMLSVADFARLAYVWERLGR